MVNPYAANPYGSPYGANPGGVSQSMPGMGMGPHMQDPMQTFNMARSSFKQANFYHQAAPQFAVNFGTRNLTRNVRNDFQKQTDQAVERESVYGVQGDPRIYQGAKTANDLGILSDKRFDAMEMQRRATEAQLANETTFEYINHEGEKRKGNSVANTLRNTKQQNMATDARIQMGQFINEGFGQRLFGGGFGNTGLVNDASGSMIQGMMARTGQNGMFGETGSNADIRGRGVLQRELTKGLLTGMQEDDGFGGKRFSEEFGDSGQASKIMKAFSRGGGLDMDDITRDLRTASGEQVKQIDPEAIKNQILPKAKMMTNTLDVLSEIYSEADPDKLMRIASELTGLNVNDARNAETISTQVATMNQEAKALGMKPSEYMNLQVSTAQALANEGFTQQVAGQLAQNIVPEAVLEHQAQNEMADLSKGGFRANTAADIAQRRASTLGGFVNDGGDDKKMVAAMLFMRHAEKRQEGASGLSKAQLAEGDRILASGNVDDLKDFNNRMIKENGINLIQKGENHRELIHSIGGEQDMYDFFEGAMASDRRNQAFFTKSARRMGMFSQTRTEVDEEGNEVMYPVMEKDGKTQRKNPDGTLMMRPKKVSIGLNVDDADLITNMSTTMNRDQFNNTTDFLLSQAKKKEKAKTEQEKQQIDAETTVGLSERFLASAGGRDKVRQANLSEGTIQSDRFGDFTDKEMRTQLEALQLDVTDENVAKMDQLLNKGVTEEDKKLLARGRELGEKKLTDEGLTDDEGVELAGINSKVERDVEMFAATDKAKVLTERTKDLNVQETAIMTQNLSQLNLEASQSNEVQSSMGGRETKIQAGLAAKREKENKERALKEFTAGGDFWQGLGAGDDAQARIDEALAKSQFREEDLVSVSPALDKRKNEQVTRMASRILDGDDDDMQENFENAFDALDDDEDLKNAFIEQNFEGRSFKDKENSFEAFKDRMTADGDEGVGARKNQKNQERMVDLVRLGIEDDAIEGKTKDGFAETALAKTEGFDDDKLKEEQKELAKLNSVLEALGERLGEINQAQNAEVVKIAPGTVFKARFEQGLQTMILQAE